MQPFQLCRRDFIAASARRQAYHRECAADANRDPDPSARTAHQRLPSRSLLRAAAWLGGIPGSQRQAIRRKPATAGVFFIQWASGRIQYISGFESLQDAEHWIAAEAQNWLNALDTQL